MGKGTYGSEVGRPSSMTKSKSRKRVVTKGPEGKTVTVTRSKTKPKKVKAAKDNTKKLERNAKRTTRASARQAGGVAKEKIRMEGGLKSNTKAKNARNRERLKQLEKKKKKLMK